MVSSDSVRELREYGVVLLRDVFPKDRLIRLSEAATECFGAIAAGRSLPEVYRFNGFSHSLLLAALSDFGGGDERELTELLRTQGLEQLFSVAIDGAWSCPLPQAWVRKKFAPQQAPSSPYHPQNWHQDGALGVRFPLQPGPVIPMTELMTCWIPLQSCGLDSPGLEFVRSRQEALLHFTELDDAGLRQRFPPDRFWAPAFEPGDGAVFLNGTLHRTYTNPEMRYNRLSVEYRLFPMQPAADLTVS